MFHDLDEVLRQLLIREMPVKNGEVDITFEQPTREWAARLSRPTLNLFLHDVRENIKLRHSQQWMVEPNPDGTATQRRPPPRIDLHYMVTAWANDPDDEHNLLARVLIALFRESHLPDDLLLESLQNQNRPIPLQVAQEDTLRNPADVWNALDNEIRPAITLMVTLEIDPYEPIITPLTSTREMRYGQVDDPSQAQELLSGAADESLWTIGGTLRTDQPLEELRLVLLERGLDVSLEEGGEFTVGKLRAGEYTLEVATDGQTLKQFTIQVPAPDYELEI
jgi:hypothetical protein